MTTARTPRDVFTEGTKSDNPFIAMLSQLRLVEPLAAKDSIPEQPLEDTFDFLVGNLEVVREALLAAPDTSDGVMDSIHFAIDHAMEIGVWLGLATSTVSVPDARAEDNNVYSIFG